MTFGVRLKQLRKERDLLQEDLAERSGVSLGSIREYEQERRLPGWEAVVLMCRALGVPVTIFSDCDEVSEGTSARPAAEPPKRQRQKSSGSAAPVKPTGVPDEPQNPAERDRVQKLKGKAVEAAHEAISHLMKIRRDNPGRARAFQMVEDWCKNNP
jgi:transcriptional regulator with XRE-family HTH domain